jgi:hypothetical protein
MNEAIICPHCDRPGIVTGSSRYFSRGWPATCRQCGALAYDRPHGVLAAFSFLSEFIVAPILCLGLILFPRIFSVVVLSAIVFLIVRWLRQRGRPPIHRFHAISPDSSRHSRRLTYFAIFVVLAAFGLAVAF